MSMLDDFVEHSAGPSAPRYAEGYRGSARQAGPADISAVEYEGFEDDEYSVENGQMPNAEEFEVVQALETGFIPTSRSNGLPPLFSLSLVQYAPPSSIICFTSANNLLFLAAAPLSLIIIDLNKPDELVTIELPRPAADKSSKDSSTRDKDPLAISKLFVDPSARHLIITTNSGDAFYLPVSPGNSAVQSRRPRPLRVKQTITAVAWSPISGTTSETTGESSTSRGDAITPPPTDVLLGTASGQILSLPLPPQDDIFKSVAIGVSKQLERDLQTVYSLPDDQAVTGVAFGFWNAPQGSTSGSKSKKEKRAWVVITTKERMYEVQGNVSTVSAGGKSGGWAEEVFKPIREGAPKFQELPGSPPCSDLEVYLPTTDGQIPSALPAPSAAAWITGPGLYTSPLSTAPSADILSKPSLFPYPSFEDAPPPFSRAPVTTPLPPPIPIAVAITQWHWLLLYRDHLVAVSRENEKVVWDEVLPLEGNEGAIGLSADPISRTFWVYTDRSILEVLVRNEDRDVWRAKLEKGDFDEALRLVKSAPQKDIVLSKQGDALFEQGRFIQAAQCYAQCSRSFEYVTLRFVDADEKDALRVYLSDRLDLLDKRDRTQRMMLATWLVEIYLSKCNTLEDILAAESLTSDVESLTIERQMMEEDMKNFITTYQNDLEPKLVYDLILSHGRTDLYLFFAGLNSDHGKIVEHWITEGQWLKAIDTLNRQESIDLYYRFASVLMRHRPKETVDSWLRQSQLSPKRLIPALLQHPKGQTAEGIRYLSHVVYDQQSTDMTIYNLLLTFYATDPNSDDSSLLHFLSTVSDDPVTEKPYYDLDYALRLCKLNGRVQPCVHIYSKMGLYENSVDLALEKGDLDLAKINADKPEDDEALRKKLWLKIAKYVVQEKKDIKSAMRFLESTDLVKIEDILPFFPDFVVIDDFKAEICNALEEYSSRIEQLKQEMDEATASAESIKRDIDNLGNRFVTVEAGDKCWKCGLALLVPNTARQFYVFPCQHGFHADCLITMATEFLPAPSLRRILHLQNELVSKPDPANRALLSSNFASSGSGSTTPRSTKPQPATGSTATDLLLGVTGRNKLLAAGDKLRELIIPDVLAQAISVVGAGVGVGSGGPVNGAGAGKGSRRKDGNGPEGVRAEELRKELDGIVAAVCPLCEGSVVGLDKGFVADGEGADWEV